MKCFWGGTAEVEILPGSSIKDAAKDCIELAKQLRGTVRFKFNGFRFEVDSHSTPEDTEMRYDAYAEFERLKHAVTRS